MSNSVTNAEVEDVLSSIRRLVSEDKRPLQAQKSVPANDRLVLTPALRVAEVRHDQDDFDAPDTASGDVTGTDDVPDGAAAQSDPSDGKIYDDPAHDYDSDPYNFTDDDDEDGEGEAALNLTGLEVEADSAENPTDHVDAEDTTRPDAKTDSIDTAKNATLSAKIEALETAIGKIADTWEPDTPGSDDYSGTEPPAMAWEDEVVRDARGAPLQNDVEDVDIKDDDVSDVELAEDEDDIRIEDDKDDLLTEDDDMDLQTAAPGLVTEDRGAASESEPPTQAELDDDASRVDGFVYSTDHQTIDEAVLRDLVNDIVRAELQGALGERITRNVRKLVRREIHRALTAQELE